MGKRLRFNQQDAWAVCVFYGNHLPDKHCVCVCVCGGGGGGGRGLVWLQMTSALCLSYLNVLHIDFLQNEK